MTVQNREKTIRFWGVRLGEGGKFVEHAKKGNYIAIGWTEIGSLKWLASLKNAQDKTWDKAWDKLTKQYKDIYKVSSIAVGIGSSMLVNFVIEIKEGDIVLVPDMSKAKVLIGRVNGSYEYKKNWGDNCDYRNRRTVEWIKEVKKEDLTPKLKGSLNAWLTIFSLDRHKQEIMMLIGESKIPQNRIVTGDELAKVIIGKLLDIDPKEFEFFVKHLLTLVGFEAVTTPYVGDKGVDVVGTLSPEGLTNITLKAQVRRIQGNIGIEDILKLRGTLGPDEHGVFITTGRFTKQAQAESEEPGKKPIALIDKETLVDLILNHYDELDSKYKDILLVTKREMPIRERFHRKEV